jgi:hypothetical protein
MIPPRRGFIDRPVHSLYLAIGPWVLYFGQPVFYAMLAAGSVKWRHQSHGIALAIGELNPIVRVASRCSSA